MFQGCSHVIFLHQLIRDLKVCSHLLPCSALASALLAFDGRFRVIISQCNFSCRIIVPLNRSVCNDPGGLHVVSHYCFCLGPKVTLSCHLLASVWVLEVWTLTLLMSEWDAGVSVEQRWGDRKAWHGVVRDVATGLWATGRLASSAVGALKKTNLLAVSRCFRFHCFLVEISNTSCCPTLPQEEMLDVFQL